MVNYYVSPTGNNSNDGLSTSTPKQTIDAAHTAASNGDMLILMDGIHSYSTNITITKNVSMTSLNGAVSTTLAFTIADRFITFQDVSNIVISNITFEDINVNLAVLNIGFASSGVTKPLVWPTNVTVRGCVFNTSKYAIGTKGENIAIYNNVINRKGGSGSISPILVYFVRGYLQIDGNTWTDNTNPSRFVYLAGFGTNASPYLGYINSRNGSVTVTNNIINSNTGATARTVQLIIQDTWNTRAGTEADDGLTASDVSTMRISWKVTGNTINATSTSTPSVPRVKGLVAFTPANDSNGNNYIQQWQDVYCTDNLFNCTGTFLADQGVILLDDGGSGIAITDSTTQRFFVNNNIITAPNPFVPRSGSQGNVNLCQVTTITPVDLYTAPWITTTFTPPSYNISSDLFMVPVKIDIQLVGTYETYAGKAEHPSGGSVVIPFTNEAVSQITVSNLDANLFKVIVGVSPAVAANSFWFFIRVYDINGVQVTSFPQPITVQITCSGITGASLTVELNGTTFTTNAVEISADVYEFNLSSNSEYLLTGQETNSFMVRTQSGFLSIDTVMVYTEETVNALEAGNTVPVSARVAWAASGIPSGIICRDIGKIKMISESGLHTMKFQKIQLINGYLSEGVRESIDGAYSTGWVCIWAASGIAPVYT